ncbi:hypothetical protein LEMLEM_LOCUS12732, partial [Lemmus lemmus]
LSENKPYGIIHLNIWFTVGGTIREGSGGEALLEKVCHWGWALRYKDSHHSQLVLSCDCGSRCELSAVPAGTPLPSWTLTGAMSPTKHFVVLVATVTVHHSSRKITKMKDIHT